jgi:integrase
MASIEERHDKDGHPSWRVYWRAGGREGKKQSTTWSDRGNAERAKKLADAHRNRITAVEVYAAISGLTYSPVEVERPALPTVAEWADVWLTSKTRITPGQRGRYRSQLDREILPRIGHLHLDEVDGASIAKLLNDLRAGRKDSTVTRYFACLHALFAFAVIERKIPDNPARRTDWIRDLVADDDIGEEDHVYLSEQEYDLIRAAAELRWRALLDTLAYTGARWSEVTALNVRDVRLFGRTPGVQIGKAWKCDDVGRWYVGPTKGRNRRFVSIPRHLVHELVPLVAGRPGNVLLFTAPEGGRLVHSNFRTRAWLPMVARAMRCPLHPPAGAGRRVVAGELTGVRCGDNGGQRSNGRPCGARVTPGWDRCGGHLEPPVLARSTCECPTRLRQEPTPHDLRHSHVAWLIEKGQHIVAISRRVGHHSTMITEKVYAGILPSVDAGMVAALDRSRRPAGRGHGQRQVRRQVRVLNRPGRSRASA